LQKRVVVYLHELERFVCEVGFPFKSTQDQDWVEPHHVSEAIKPLLEESKVLERRITLGAVSYRFWHLARTPVSTVDNVLQRKARAFEVYQRMIRMPPVVGWHAEHIHHLALTTSTDWVSVGWEGGRQIKTLGKYSLDPTKPGDVDLAGFHLPSRGTPFVAQVKNGREWFYAVHDAVWDLLGAAAQLHAVPILLQRRAPNHLFTFMKIVGGFTVRSTKMILPVGAHDLQPISDSFTVADALKELGFYNDVDFIDTPLARHRAPWTGPLTKEFVEASNRASMFRDDILHIAYVEELATKRRRGAESGRTRREIVEEFLDDARAALREQARLIWQEIREQRRLEGDYDDDADHDWDR